MAARDNLRSTRSKEEILHDSEVRMKAQMFKVFLRSQEDGRPGAYEEAIEGLQAIGRDPRAPVRTRAGAWADVARAASKLVESGPSFTLNQGTILDAASLLRMVQEGGPGLPNSGSLVTSGEQPALPTPTGGLQEDLRLARPDVRSPEAGVMRDSDPHDGLPERAPLIDDTDGPSTGQRSREPTGGRGDGSRCARCHARTDDEPGHDSACPVPEEIA